MSDKQTKKTTSKTKVDKTEGKKDASKKPNSKNPNKDSLIKLSMDMAALQGWEIITLSDIADEAQISLADLRDMFEDKTDILIALGRIIDRKTLENVGKQHPETALRDALFDVLMERYDVLNEYRGGIIAILKSFRYDPKQAIISMPHLCRSMTWMAEAAGVETNGIRGAARVAGLTGIYLKVLKTWSKDESKDLGTTMAELDKALNRAEQFANTLGL